MTGIVNWAVGSSRLILAIVAVVVIAGVVSFMTIPKEANPDIPIPYLYVSIVYPGTSPEDSERLLIRPMEETLKTVEGVKHITAQGSLGYAFILMEFDINFNKEKALNDVRAAVQAARSQIPPDALDPTVHEINLNIFPVITVSLSGDAPERTLVHVAKDLRDRIKNIPSVLDVNLDGVRDELLEVEVDPAKLESYGLTQQDLLSAVTRNNQLIPAGQIDNGKGSFQVNVSGLVKTPEDVFGIVVKASDDNVVTLRDIAQVRRTFYDATSFSRFNGKPSVALEVEKRLGENIIATNEKVREVVAEAAKAWPKGIHVDFANDASDDIRDSLNSLSDSVLLAVLLVMVVIVAALGLRSGLLVGFAIPTSFLMSFFILKITGMPLNTMIMFAMLLAVGILVDGAIVVVEYADRKMTEGQPPRQAFAAAGVRMFWPVVAATCTMLAAFLPMLLWPGVPGKFMSYFPITLIIVLCSSMVVALIFLPVIGGIFGKAPDYGDEHTDSVEASETGDWRKIPGITGWYAHLAERLTQHPWTVLAGALATAVAVIVVFIFGNHGVEFFVDTDPTQVVVTVSARGNLSAYEKRDLVVEVEKAILPIVPEGIKTISTGIGGGGQQIGGNSVADDTIGRIYLEFTDYRERKKGRDIEEDIRNATRNFAGIKVEMQEQQGGPSSGKPIQMELTSQDIPAVLATTARVRDHLDHMGGLRDIEDTRPLPGIQWGMHMDREQAGRFGADAVTIGTAIELVTDGALVARYRPDDADDVVDIRVRYPMYARGISAMDQLRVATKNGMVPISNFVERVAEPQVTKVDRLDGRRIYRVRANVDPGVNVNAKVAEIQKWMAGAGLPLDVNVKFGGGNEDQAESAQFLMLIAIPAALFLISAVLLAMFNSFYSTALVLLAVILAWIGSLLGMVIMRQPFSVIMTGTGMLALAGIVVNHNIVLIDTYSRLYHGGMDRIEAIIRSSAQRLRPVFLTTVTAIFGLIPMMYAVEINFFTRKISFGSPSALWWVGLSTAIIFGLAFSKAITMGLVPAMLALPVRIKERRAARRGKHRGAPTLKGPSSGSRRYVDGSAQGRPARGGAAAE